MANKGFCNSFQVLRALLLVQIEKEYWRLEVLMLHPSVIDLVPMQADCEILCTLMPSMLVAHHAVQVVRM